MARASSSGQAVIELIIATLFVITLLAAVVSVTTTSDRILKERSFRTREAIRWNDTNR